MVKEGSLREINGDSYLVVFDHGEMETLSKGDFLSVYFPNLGILLPLGKVKRPSRKIVDKGNSLDFNGVIFAKEPGYIQPVNGVTGFFAKIHCNTFVFKIDSNGKLIGVSFK